MKKLDEIVERLNDPPQSDKEVTGWIAGKMQEMAKHAPPNKETFLLAHADDGVIWGKLVDGKLVTSNDLDREISPPLRGVTLQQAFLFHEAYEIRLFRDELGKWQARKITDPPQEQLIEERQILWGYEDRDDSEFPIQLDHGFTHVREKKQEALDQILPTTITKDDFKAGKRARLKLRHFLECDENTGEARIGLSRLVNVEVADAAQA